MAETTARGSSSPGAMSKGTESGGSVAMRCASSLVRIAAAVGLAGAQRLAEAGKDRLHADQRIRPDVEVGGFEPIAQAARRIVELDLVGLRPEVPAADVIGEAGADREHDVGGFVDLPAERREVAAGDAEPERMVVEQAARRQRVGEKGAAA